MTQAFKQFFDRQNEDTNRGKLRQLNAEILTIEGRIVDIQREIADKLNGRTYDILQQDQRAEYTAVKQLEAWKRDAVRKLGGTPDPNRLPTDRELTEIDILTEFPQALELQGQIALYEQEITGIKGASNIGEGHHTVRVLRGKQNALKLELERYVTEQLAGPTDDSSRAPTPVDALRREVAIIDSQLAVSRQRSIDLAERVQEIESIRARLETEQDRLEGLNSQKLAVTQTIKAAAENSTRVQVRPYASLPGQPYNAEKQLQNAVLGALGGGGVGFGLIIMAGLFDRRLRHAADARTGMPDIRMLGILPTLPRNIKDPQQAETAAHSVHHVRTLLQIATEEGKRVFTITSPAAGSGKSSLTVALGLSFSAAGSRTLLIDCDVVGAGLSRRLGGVVRHPLEQVLRDASILSEDVIDQAVREARRRDTSLGEVLMDRDLLTAEQIDDYTAADLSSTGGILEACAEGCLTQCVAGTDVANLSVLPVGSAGPNDAGALSPQTLRRLVDQARAEFDVVLVDTGPVLGSLEASMIASHSDGVIFIVSRGDAKSLINRSLEHLQSIGARMLGVVFNHASDSDLRDTSYGSMVSIDRRLKSDRKVTPDPVTSARLGPLGSAVAAYSHRSKSKSANGHPAPPTRNGHVESVNGEAFLADPVRSLD